MCILTINEIQNAITPIAKAYGLEKVYLFGSYARGEARDDSDVDLLIKGFKRTKPFAFPALFGDIEDTLSKHVDIVTVESFKYYNEPFHKDFQNVITAEAVTLYEQR